MARVTIRDVARASGRSIATVSRVLNGQGSASAQARADVEAAAKSLGFRFNEVGRTLRSNRSRTIGVIVPTLTNPVFGEAVDGIEEVARTRNLQVLLSCVNYDPLREAEAIAMLASKQVGGLIMTVSDADNSTAVAEARALGLPFVLIFNQPTGPMPAVGVDNKAAGAMVGERLIGLGHTHVAFIAGHFAASDRSRQRFEGLTAIFVERGLPAPTLVEVDYRAPRHGGAVAKLLRNAPDITALFASNDMLALAMMADLRALGLSVPDDMSVVGFDGIGVGAMTDPALATVVASGGPMGRAAAARLADALERPDTDTLRDGFTRLPFQFRPGGSLAARVAQKNRTVRSYL
ncbi:MAG: LacI family DNA-binding transcriptional regulator [Devosia sp.]